MSSLNSMLPDTCLWKYLLNTFYIQGGAPPTMELSSGGWAPCSTGFPHYVSVLGTRLYQYASWHFCERLCSASEFFFKNSFSIFVHFVMGDLQAHLPTQHWLVSSFWPKKGMTPIPHPPYSPDLTSGDYFFLCPRWKKSSKGNILPMRKRWNKKKAEALKGTQIDEFKNCFEQWEKGLSKCIASNGECFEGDWSLNI